MKPKRCPRTWEAEALEDGQLAGADKGSFERHLRTCSICQHEVDAHAKVLAIVHHVPRPQTTPLAHRQSRIRLLDRASERRTGTDFSTRQRWLALAAITVLCIVAVSGVWSLLPSERRALPPTAVAHSAPVPLVPVFDVADVNHAVWTRQAEGSVARPVLEDGVAAFHVEPMVAGQRFLLGLPDGELEVRGTRFVVNVHEGRTESVQVTEGIVALRIQGKAERLLRAGDEWSPVAEERAVAVNDLPTHVMKVEPVTPSRPRAAPPLALHGATNAPPLGPAGSSQPVPAAVGRTAAGERYGAAAEAFRAGAYAEADALLAAFNRDFSNDPRGEDAAFLRAVAHSRMGDHGGAASLARAYLQSYPHGLRRREAEQLTSDAVDSSRPDAGSLP